MMTTDVILNGKKTKHPPINIEELQVELNYDTDFVAEQAITLTSFEFIDEDAQRILDYYNAGLTGGVGIFEGLPIKLRLVDGGTTSTLLDGYLDLTTADFDCDKVVADAVPKKQIDWLNEVADTKTFEYLFRKEAIIAKSDWVFVPYVINAVPNYRDIMIALITTTIVTKESIKVGQEVAAAVAEAATIIDSVGGIIRAIFLIIYFAAIVVTLIELILQLVDLIIQPIKYKPSMYAVDLAEKACQSLGMNFSSSILQSAPFNKMVVIPESLNNPADNDKPRILGFLSPDSAEQHGFYNGTLGDFFREMKLLFNAKLIIDGNTLKLEPRNFHPGNPKFKIPPIHQHIFSTNANEITAQFNFAFSYDVNDKNTIQEWTGTNVQAKLEPKTIGNKDYYLLKGFNEAQSKFALAKKKTELTPPEEIVDAFLEAFDAVVGVIVSAVNGIIGLINSITDTIEKIAKLFNLIGIDFDPDIPDVPQLEKPDFGSLIDDRIGMMKLENDIVSVPKLAIIKEGATDRKTKLHDDNETYLRAKYLYETYYRRTSFAPNKNHGQYKIFDLQNVPFCFDDYLDVRNNPKVLTADGKTAELITLKWNVRQQTAEMRIKINELFTNNLQEVIYEPVGR